MVAGKKDCEPPMNWRPWSPTVSGCSR